MTKPLRPSHLPILLLALALGLTGCVKPRPTPTPMPTKVALHPSATATVATAAVRTATPTSTLVATVEPTAKVTPTATQTATPAATAPAAGEITYEVRWGDTLSSIARAYSTTVEAIMARNPRITNASQVYAGMVLVIPAGTTTPPTGATLPAPSGTYIVQRGDTLSSIARRFGTTVQALLEANPTLPDRNTVYAGQRLVIPSSAAAPSGQRTHVVQPGDTLTAIARLYGTTVMAIVQRNNLPNQNAIFVGQVLIIP